MQKVLAYSSSSWDSVESEPRWKSGKAGINFPGPLVLRSQFKHHPLVGLTCVRLEHTLILSNAVYPVVTPRHAATMNRLAWSSRGLWEPDGVLAALLAKAFAEHVRAFI